MIRIGFGGIRRMIAIGGLCIVTMTSATFAEEPDRKVRVVGWKANVDRTHVQVLDSNGNDLGVRDLSRMPIEGVKDWITSYDFIRIGPNMWVQASDLDLRFCQLADDGPDKGNSRPKPHGAFGSGNGC